MASYNLKQIQTVPSSTEFIDIILSKTQRKTPTVVHKGYAITRIRAFYMRKVKYTQSSFDEKLDQILTDFPKLDDIHPFYADLMNVLYDKDHYKLALAQLNTAKHLIDSVGKDHLRLLKFGDSLYRCKMLKKAALGKMATIMKRQKESLAYLEQVRQHLSRLPSIDPNTRTLLVCGYPNVGKSSFMNKVTRADVDVQPYAFTTKSLFVGHMDYKYLRWQVIDTPGILDHPLEDRNTIEMQSITALAHIRACVLYFIDISEECGFTIEQQVKLFENIKPLFSNKPLLVVLNKVDLIKPEDLSQGDRDLLQTILDQGVEMCSSSSMTDDGLMEMRNKACEKLLSVRVESKMKGQKINDVLSQLRVAVPATRDEKIRAPVQPILPDRPKYDRNDPNRIRLERDIEEEHGGAGVYNIDLKKLYLLKKDEWKHDVIPEILNGKNVADYIDPEIAARLDELEEEEEKLEAEGAYLNPNVPLTAEEKEIKRQAEAIRAQQSIAVQKHRINKGRNRPSVPAKASIKRSASTQRETKQKRSRSESRNESVVRSETRERGKSVTRDRSTIGMSDTQQTKATKMKHNAQKSPALFAKKGESDRQIRETKPRHLYSGKRGIGSNQRR